jgi:putative transposase
LLVTRKSWDTSLKHIVRNGLLYDVLSSKQIASIPRSNISRWKHEADDKYLHSEINQLIKSELDLIKRMNQSHKIKRIITCYFRLCDAFHKILSEVRGIKPILKKHKDLIVNTIENVKDIVPITDALKVFNISRATYQYYKSKVLHICNTSYFKWCTKRFSNQLLVQEVIVIKKYMKNDMCKFWSKSSIYLKAVRDENLYCCISTFYKYCKLLGFENRQLKNKFDDYSPIRTTCANELWCADVTIFKTIDGTKYYIHFLMDHYSKMILGFSIEKSNSAKAIRNLLHDAYFKFKPENVRFLSDGGAENVNTTVSSFLNSLLHPIKHIIAQRDVIYSNSMIEALNKIIKHQFLHHRNISSGKTLLKILTESVIIYNKTRPQKSLGGNTPFETFNGIPINFSKYTKRFTEQKILRITQNKQSNCTNCH